MFDEYINEVNKQMESKEDIDGWEKDDLKVYSDGLIMSLEEYEI